MHLDATTAVGWVEADVANEHLAGCGMDRSSSSHPEDLLDMSGDLDAHLDEAFGGGVGYFLLGDVVGALPAVADSYAPSNLVLGTKRRIAGLHLAATDTDWKHGSGELVSGPMTSYCRR